MYFNKSNEEVKKIFVEKFNFCCIFGNNSEFWAIFQFFGPNTTKNYPILKFFFFTFSAQRVQKRTY